MSSDSNVLGVPGTGQGSTAEPPEGNDSAGLAGQPARTRTVSLLGYNRDSGRHSKAIRVLGWSCPNRTAASRHGSG